MSELNRVDLGSIKIHKKVLAEIAHNAVNECEGIRLVTPQWGWIAGKLYPGVHVDLDKNNQVMIELKVVIQYGLNIPDTARKVQDHVRAAIESTLDIDLRDVNVNIQGIERGST